MTDDKKEIKGQSKVKLAMENAQKPGKASNLKSNAKPESKADHANVFNIKDDTVLFNDLKKKIDEEYDFHKLVYQIAKDIHFTALRKASKERLYKEIASKAGITIDLVKKELPDIGGEKPSYISARYIIHNGKICLPGNTPSALCSGSMRIIEQVKHDSGEESENETFFCIEGKTASGELLGNINVASASFNGLAWVTANWGAEINIYAGSAVKDQVRDAINELSTDIKKRTLYTHTGWRCFDGDWLYLHCAGAIGKDGNKEGIEVNPGQGHMGLYRLPVPENGEKLTQAIHASMGLFELAPNKPELGALLLAAIYRAPTAEAAIIDHSAWLYATSGSFKSEAAALALAHFGEFDGRSLPSNWIDSAGNMEIKNHAAKDAVIVIDDFNPTGSAQDISKMQAKADHVLRGVGNHAGRGTLTAHRTIRTGPPPRGFVLVTGEEQPKGLSLRGRITILHLNKGDITASALTERQKSARNGLYRLAMAAYLKWLASKMDELKKELPEMIRKFRDEALSAGFASAHARTSSDYASLKVGICLFLEFATESGALTSEAAADFLGRTEKALLSLMAMQADGQREECPVRKFFSLLKSGLSSGEFHVADRFTLGPPDVCPHSWGWRTVKLISEDGKSVEKTNPQGLTIGWKDNEYLYLDGEAAFSQAQVSARRQGAAFEVTKHTLWKRVHEYGCLLARTSEEAGRVKPQVQARIEGVKKWVYCCASNVFEHEKLSV